MWCSALMEITGTSSMAARGLETRRNLAVSHGERSNDSEFIFWQKGTASNDTISGCHESQCGSESFGAINFENL